MDKIMGNSTVGSICKIFSVVLLILALIVTFIGENLIFFLVAIPSSLLFFAIGEIVEHLDAISANTYVMCQQLSKLNTVSDTWYCPKCGVGNDGAAEACKNCGSPKN